eukprot:TRINITY_DN12018_c0_g2_i1.p1 TRINITY_DN12018_c0_g2~~TRINITY_DN12018_c0_g2_i1.p1  ORF type:complete len:163 (+),score=49.26 TRINITY_DN12018_c0_g2_i1:61-489(+)
MCIRDSPLMRRNFSNNNTSQKALQNSEKPTPVLFGRPTPQNPSPVPPLRHSMKTAEQPRHHVSSKNLTLNPPESSFHDISEVNIRPRNVSQEPIIYPSALLSVAGLNLPASTTNKGLFASNFATAKPNGNFGPKAKPFKRFF